MCLQEVTAVTDNSAVLQQRVGKSSNPFLATLPGAGISQYLTAVKPCGIVMPHIHLRGNELYTVLYGADTILHACRPVAAATADVSFSSALALLSMPAAESQIHSPLPAASDLSTCMSHYLVSWPRVRMHVAVCHTSPALCLSTTFPQALYHYI